VHACAGALLWAYRDSNEADGVTVQVPKAQLDQLQKDVAAIKQMLGV
jgi:hypothetical protein